ncbi:MAG: HAMP domain-containing protein [Spirochaetia bacterium]|nr:HAMP domain-containing protein [Spirochaetia bacterium]
MFGGISLIIFILVSSIVFFFFRDLILAIRSLNQAMKDIDKSGNQSNLDINRKDEIGEITKVFLSMKDKIINHQKNLETTIDQRTNELKISKDRATRAYLDLEASQKQLVQSDKMITLGTMLAGVAHEINTPLGAIKANSENILEALRGLILKLNPFQSHLTLEELQTALKILDLSKDPITALSSREARAMRKKVISLLEEERFSNVELLADFIIDLNLVEALERNEEILKTLQLERILSIAADLHGIRKKSTVIKTSAERVSKIVKSLKSFMHFDQDEKKIPADLTEGMETVLIILHNKIKMGIEVTKNYGEDVPQIICFPDELNQVWTNLIHNAIQAMDEKGSLQIDIEKVPSPAGNPDIDKRNPEYKGEYISVSIQDSGSGTSPEIRQKIFQAFFTTKPAGEGSGLGLHIIGKILEKHEGALYLESEPGRTRFSVLLPLGNESEV